MRFPEETMEVFYPGVYTPEEQAGSAGHRSC